MSILDAKQILIAEDNWLQATEIADILRDVGMVVIGPVRNALEGMRAVETAALEAALLDVTLGSDTSYGIAAALKANSGSNAFIPAPT